MKPVRSHIGWCWGAVVLVAILLWMPRLKGPIDLRWDAGVYYVLGSSLANGQGYRIISEPGNPQALQYPPLLPAVVAFFQRSLHSGDILLVGQVLRIFYAIMFVLYGLAVFALAKRYLLPFCALVATTFCLVHHSAIFLSDALFSEIPFAVITVAFVLIAGRRSAIRPWLRETALFILGSGAFLLRTAGAALLAAWIFDAALQRNVKLAAFRTTLALLPIVAWELHVNQVRSSYDYQHPAYAYQRAPYQFYNVSYGENIFLVDPLNTSTGRITPAALAGRTIANFLRVGRRAGEAVSASEFYWRSAVSETHIFAERKIAENAVRVVILGLSGLTGVGLMLLLARREWLIALYIVGSIVLICITPWPSQFDRYLAPLSPFLLIAIMIALARILRGTHRSGVRRVGQAVVVAVLTMIGLVQLFAGVTLFRERSQAATIASAVEATKAKFFYHDRGWTGWEEAVAWIRQNAAQDAIVATQASHLCFLLTGRRAVSPPKECDLARARQLLDSVPVSYVIVNEDSQLRAIETDTLHWQLIGIFEGTKLYGSIFAVR